LFPQYAATLDVPLFASVMAHGRSCQLFRPKSSCCRVRLIAQSSFSHGEKARAADAAS
jgi:hypothetical protein